MAVVEEQQCVCEWTDKQGWLNCMALSLTVQIEQSLAPQAVQTILS